MNHLFGSIFFHKIDINIYELQHSPTFPQAAREGFRQENTAFSRVLLWNWTDYFTEMLCFATFHWISFDFV